MFARVLQRSMRLSASLNAPKTAVASPIVRAIAAPLRSAPTRALHTTRIARAETSKTLGSVHVLDAPAVTGWSEIPAGRGIYKGLSYKETVWKVWYNHAITPLYATIVIASGLMTWFMYRYFTSHTEIAWSKSLRGTYDHTGLDERRAEAHSNRLLYPGMREGNKREVNIFPFSFQPMHKIAEKRFVDYNSASEE